MDQKAFAGSPKWRVQWKYSWLHCLVLYVLGAFAFVDSGRIAEATCILEIRTPTETVLASDERRGQLDLKGARATTTACKIYRGPSRIYFAAAGVNFDLNGRWISPEALLPPARFIGLNTCEQVRNAINSLHSDMSNAWLELNRSNAQFFTKVVENHATHVIFGWADDKEAGAASYSAIPLAGGYSSSPEIHFYPDPHIPSTITNPNWIAGGECDQPMKKLIKDKLKGNSLPADTDLPILAKQLIQLAIDANAAAHPDITQRTVGSPVDVLVITLNGTHSYQREAASKCSELP